ncbi:MAG: class I SAM-dependent methyltransferase [Chamaesiphon sp.]|nr:class I SAM-dependent methyltransferase [Chamaesiphon sp.]
MSSSTSTKDLYNGIEFPTWIELENLNPQELYLIQKYLLPDLKTVEAGTNGGRILLEMQEMGFTDLAGFDFVPALIDRAIERDRSRSIDFQVGDAIALAYATNSFDQIVYLQQIVCIMDNTQARLRALQEAYRILKPGGTGLFSFLSFDSRHSQFIYASYLKYLTTIRKLRGDNRSMQELPWLKLGGKFNPNALFDRPPYIYWYRHTEICDLVRSVGFEIVAIGSDPQIEADRLVTSDRELATRDLAGMLYVVVKK